MPKTQVTAITDFWMSPSGKLLAVAGTTGLQVFHFNGANPITTYTGLLTKNEIDQVFWDNNNHLYAVSRPTGKLYVFTVTPTSHSQAPGSPYTITNPQNLIVLPK
jgi:outer membrane protein assembly factor BamB